MTNIEETIEPTATATYVVSRLGDGSPVRIVASYFGRNVAPFFADVAHRQQLHASQAAAV